VSAGAASVAQPEASMDAVLPLTLRDVERASLLLESLAARFQGLGALWVVCPDHELLAVERALGQVSGGLPLLFRGEASLVPELALTPWLKGWYRQQLVKLAIFEHVQSPLYLTLDADVICTKPVTPELLAPQGLAPCHVTARDLHPDWYRGSEAVLGLDPPRRGVSHNVTPAILHREGVAELAGYLERKASIHAFAPGLRGFKQKALCARARHSRAPGFAGWRLLLAAGTPWTEYALYYTFLESTGRFERFHAQRRECIYDLDGSYWRADRRKFAEWTPRDTSSHAGAPWFVVVQSNTRVAPAVVRRKFQGFLRDV
jgi:hypothetical protein